MSFKEYTSEEENTTLETLGLQQLFEGNSELSEHTDLGEEDLIADLLQHFEHLLHLDEQPQSLPFDHHQSLPPLTTMSNQPATAATTTTPQVSELHLRDPKSLMDLPSRPMPGWSLYKSTFYQ